MKIDYKFNILAVILVLAGITQLSFAQSFTTKFNMEFELTSDWKKYPTDKINLQHKNIDKDAEIFYFKTLSTTDFIDNIYITSIQPNQLKNNLKKLTNTNLQKYCKEWQQQVVNRFKEINVRKKDFNFSECKILDTKNSENRGIYLAYNLTNEIYQSQYLLFLPKNNVLITATYADKNSLKVKQDFQNLINSITYKPKTAIKTP